MRVVAWMAVAAVACAAPARADADRLNWPLRPRPAVMRVFDAPSPNWQRGHRGVDLAGVPGQAVYAAGPGTVVFAGVLAGRPVVSVAHPGGLRTSYEPVVASVRPGQLGGFRHGARRAGRRTRRLPGPGLPALGCDVGAGRQRRLRRSARAARDDADPAQTPTRVTRTARLLRDRELAVNRDLCAVSKGLPSDRWPRMPIAPARCGSA